MGEEPTQEKVEQRVKVLEKESVESALQGRKTNAAKN
jgi:hypothetical protein